MSAPKPSDHGIVVDHKEAPVRYAILDEMFDEKIHKYVRDLKPGETVIGYQPKSTEKVVEELGAKADAKADSAPQTPASGGK